MPKNGNAAEVDVSRSGWVRNQLLHKPDITIEQLQAAYDKTDRPKKDRPKDQQVLYQARSQLMKRWELGSLDEIPRAHGRGDTLSVAGMVRRYLSMFGGDANYEHAVNYFAADGLELKPGNWHSAKSNYLRNMQAQPDANQDAGPRAGKPEEEGDGRRRRRRKKGRRTRRAAESGDQESPLGRYQQIEQELDLLISLAEGLKNRQLAEELRNARRRAGAGVLQHS